ncbi:hypothetical protein LJR129_004097 [Acidovorax sp. LjRoot129]|uniref:hypothetical protein n=1 Tax=Acidovorax sp. LjRoot129 TaxID=3342260 RepID=UPI003ECC3D3A
MTRIDTAAAINALLKFQADSTRRSKMNSGDKAGTARGPGEGDESLGIADGTLLLERSLRLRMRTIAEDDPQRPRKVFRMFVESVLLKQLGPSLAMDGEFARIVDMVLQRIDEDPELRESSSLAATVLIEHSGED